MPTPEGHLHFVTTCEGHGIVVAQCRCPSTSKARSVTPCPDSEWHDRQVVEHLRSLALRLAGDGDKV